MCIKLLFSYNIFYLCRVTNPWHGIIYNNNVLVYRHYNYQWRGELLIFIQTIHTFLTIHPLNDKINIDLIKHNLLKFCFVLTYRRGEIQPSLNSSRHVPRFRSFVPPLSDTYYIGTYTFVCRIFFFSPLPNIRIYVRTFLIRSPLREETATAACVLILL